MSVIAEYADLKDVSVLTGAPEDVRKQLDELPDAQVVAVLLPHASAETAHAIAKTIVNIAQLVPALVEVQLRDTLESVVEAFVPKIVPTPNVLKEAHMLARARTAVLESGDWMTAAEIAEVAGFSKSNTSAQPNKWKREKSIFAIRHNGIDYFPSYGLDATAGYRPLKDLATVMRVFGDRKDGWGLAYWFMSPNGFLGGKRPQDLLLTEPQRVIDAAKDELEEIAHA